MSHVKSYSQRLDVSGRLVESDGLELMPYGTLDVGIVVRHVYRWIEKKNAILFPLQLEPV